MKVLLATNHLWSFTGSELNLIGLARALAARGHDVACCAVFLSPVMCAGLRHTGPRVLADGERELADFAPDAAFCQHHTAAAMVRAQLPMVPMLLAHLGVEPELEQAPLLDCGVGVHLAISEETRDALIAQNLPADRMRIFRNAIDTRILDAQENTAPKRDAILFSYKLSREATSLIEAATHGFGITLDPSSLTGLGWHDPAEVGRRLRAARLVFASGRCALEAAVAGAAVVVLGPKGLDGALTSATWRTLAEANFSGRRHAMALTAESLRQAISDALEADVAAMRRQLRAEFGLEGRCEELEALLSACPPPALNARDLALNQRLSRLLHEQRSMAVRQIELERSGGLSRWWNRLIRRGMPRGGA